MSEDWRVPLSFEDKVLAVFFTLVLGGVVWLSVFSTSPAEAQGRKCYEVDLTIKDEDSQRARAEERYWWKRVNGVICEK